MEQLAINIHDGRRVAAVQQEFTDFFPNLKLEFFAKPNTSDGPHSERRIRDLNTTLGDCRTVHNDGIIRILREESVRQLTEQFRDVYGLEVKVISFHEIPGERLLADLNSLSKLNESYSLTDL